MALWEKLQGLPGDALRQVQALYGDNFPIEVRCALSQWIEEKPWNDLDPDNPQHENYVMNLIPSLVNELHAKANAEENFLMRLKLGEAATNFQQNYTHNPFMLVRIVKQCLQGEMKIIQQSENPCMQVDSQAGQFQVDPAQEITNQIEKMRRRTQECEEELRKMQQEQEQFVIQYQEFQKRQNFIQQLTSQNGQGNLEVLNKCQKEKEMLDNALRQKANALVQIKMEWVDKHQVTYKSLHAIQVKVLDEQLIRWKRGQQLGGNGAAFDNNLDRIQEWCEALAELIWQNRQQLKRVETLCTHVPLQLHNTFTQKMQTLNESITSLLSNLVTSTFVIEKQPPQVMKTNTRFTSTVRLLVGGKLNVHMTPPTVKVSIISESQANCLLKNDKIMNESSGDILNNTGTMEYHSGTRQLSVNFRNMQLRKIKRTEKKGTESVMDEKFSLLFQSLFKVGGGELIFQVWTLSLPVVVIVHGNQEPHAWATVTWDNAFAEPGRAPFVVPDKVPWQRVGEVLSMKFKSYVGRDLNADSLRFLAGKSFRNMQLQEYDSLLLNWGQFCKEPLPERNFTFWEWFYAILKVTREHIRGLWNDGTVVGFVGRKQAEDLLLQRPHGTFLLRYSDSELGGVTIAWGAEGQDGPEVFMLQPFTSRDFGIRGLADRINDLKHLIYLYPDIPKDQAFGKYYTPFNESQPTLNGYVKPVLVTQIPGWTGSSLDSYPNTPQSVLHNPNSPSDSLSYHDNPASVRSCVTDHLMNDVGSTAFPEMDYDLLNMDIPEMNDVDLDIPVDFSTINVSELMGAYDKTN